jgi:hypothetical protein
MALLGVFALNANSAEAITVTNPGANNMVIESGFLKVGDTLENALDDLDPKPSLAGTIDANGNINVPKSSFNFGTLEFPVDTDVDIIGHIEGVIGIEINPTHDVTGTIDPLTGESNLLIRLKIRAYRISGSSLLDVGNNCYLGSDAAPITLNMSTETGPIATNTPDLSQGGRRYDISNGTARYADKTFSAPGQSGCSGLAASQINGLLGLPSASGLNAAEFEVSLDPAPISNATLNITTKPAAATNQTNANFAFTSNVPSGLDYECKLDSAPSWTPCNSKTASYSGLADGSHTFRARAIAGGNDVGSTSYTWSIDTVIPVYTVNGAPSGLVNTRSANITFTVGKTMPPGSARCSLDGATPTACTSPQNLTGLADGPHSFAVSGTDSVGNFGSTTKNWTVDATKPVASIDSGPVGVSSTADVDFTFSATDNMTANPAIQCQIKNRKDDTVVQTWTACTSPYHQVRPTGKWQLQVRASDNAGNVSDVQTYDWDANTAEPVIIGDTFTFNGDPTVGHSGGTSSSDAEFEFEAATYELDENDEPVEVEGTNFTYECWLDEVPLGACESPMTLHDLTGGTPMAEGPHTFEVKPTTVALPPVPGSATAFHWIVDTVTPTAAIVDGPGHHNNSSTASFALDVDGTGSQGTAQCKLDDQAKWVDCDSNTSEEVTVSDGEHKLQVRAIDQAGNASQAVNWIWYADTVAPLAAIHESPLDNDPSSEATFAFVTNDDDNNVEALCQIDGGSEVPCNGDGNGRVSHTWENVSDGEHVFTLTAKDQAGNTTSIDHPWRVDTTAPTLDITEGPAALTLNENAAFRFQADDNGSGIDMVECRIDSGNWVSGSDCQNGDVWNFYPGPYASGNHKIQVKITDLAGNETSKSWSWKIDRNAPDVAIATRLADSTATSASVKFFSSESEASFECKLDAGNFLPCVSPMHLDDLSVGNHVFSVRSVDQAGNKSVDDSITWAVLEGSQTCPDGQEGTYPDCHPIQNQCPEGQEGTYPDCHPIQNQCPEGQEGTYPDCHPIQEKCPDGTTGTPPNCKKIDNGTGSYDPETGKLAIRLKCPAAFKPRCRGTAVAVTGKGKKAKVMSSRVKNTSKAGKWKLVTLTIKPAFRKKVQNMSKVDAKRLIVKQTLRSKKKKKKTVYHTYKVRTKG